MQTIGTYIIGLSLALILSLAVAIPIFTSAVESFTAKIEQPIGKAAQ